MTTRRRFPTGRGYAAYRKIRYLAKTGSLFRERRIHGMESDDLSGRKYLAVSSNSLFLFLIAFLLVDTLNLFVTGFVATLFNVPVIVYFHTVEFLIRSIDWTPDSVLGVFGSGPVAMFVITLLLLILYKSVETERGMLRLLVLWMIFHAFNRFLGEVLMGALLGKGFGFVILYLFLMDTGKVVLTILSLVAMITMGLMMTRISLYTANTYVNKLTGGQHARFLRHQFLYPFLAGDVLILVLKLPDFNTFNLAVNATLLLFLLPVVIRGGRMEDLYFDEEPRDVRISLAAGLAALLTVVAFRILLDAGIRL